MGQWPMGDRRFSVAHCLLLCLAILTGCSAAPRTVVTGKGFQLYSALSFADAERYRCEAEWTVRDVNNLLGTELPSPPVRIFLFESRLGLFRFLNDCCPDQRFAAAAAFDADNSVVVALSRRWDTEETLRLLRHEVTHGVVMSNYTEVPPWAQEGIAQVFELGPPYHRTHPGLIGPLLRKVRGRSGSILPRLVAKPWGAPLTAGEYAQAWGLTRFLLEETPYGPLVLRSYLKSVRANRDAQEQFRSVFGRSPAELEPEWREYVLGLKP